MKKYRFLSWKNTKVGYFNSNFGFVLFWFASKCSMLDIFWRVLNFLNILNSRIYANLDLLHKQVFYLCDVKPYAKNFLKTYKSHPFNLQEINVPIFENNLNLTLRITNFLQNYFLKASPNKKLSIMSHPNSWKYFNYSDF